MTNDDIRQIALRQSAVDCHCQWTDFLSAGNVVAISCADDKARRYLQLPFDCHLVSYGVNVVASVRPDLAVPVKAYIDRYAGYRCFETPHLHILDDILRPHRLRVCFMAAYFLPDIPRLEALPCAVELRILSPAELADCYRPEWSNALCEKRRHLDVLAVGAYDRDRLVGLAGASADCDEMWQIGIDVLPEYRLKGIASALTSHLALEILRRDKVPFYCAAWSNVPSVRNAISSGFRPAWVELTAKSDEFVAEMNR